MQKYEKTGADGIIGHFGLGFYSAFMVSDSVEIDTLSYQEGAEPVHWGKRRHGGIYHVAGQEKNAGHGDNAAHRAGIAVSFWTARSLPKY